MGRSERELQKPLNVILSESEGSRKSSITCEVPRSARDDELTRRKSSPRGGGRVDLAANSLSRLRLPDQRANARARLLRIRLQRCFARAAISRSPDAEAQRVTREVLRPKDLDSLNQA